MNETTRQLINAYGWVEIPSKNPWMVSFKKEESTLRLNYYYTTGTISVQGDRNESDIYLKGINTDEQVEKVLIDFNIK